MATLTNYRSTILTAFLAFLFATTVAAQQSEATNGLSSVPSNAIAFAHFNVMEMLNTPGMALPTEIFAGVQQEADELFEQHLGVRISELQTVTLVAPTVESLMELQFGNNQTGFGIFAFAQPIKTNFSRDLPNSWKPSTIGDDTIFVDRDIKLAIFQSAENTIAFGPEEGIQWFVANRNHHANDGLRPAMEFAESGHVTIGINGDELPSEMKMYLPPEIQSFANTTSAAIKLNFTNGIAARIQMNFESDSDASSAVASAQQNIETAKMLLQQEESSIESQFKAQSGDLLTAMGPLCQLAFARYGNRILEKAEIVQADNQLQAHLAIEGFDGQMLVITCLTAIQAIGSSSEAEFQSIADELDSLE